MSNADRRTTMAAHRPGARSIAAFVLACGVAFSAGFAASASAGAARPSPAIAALPKYLSGTGLFIAGSTTDIRPTNLPFSPQYPLWSDAATKRRWIALPPGTWIDASNPNAWQFPRGTRLWKEFSMGGRRVETRFIERLADGHWRFSAYVWNAAQTAAELAPTSGIRNHSVEAAPRGRYAIPAEADCRACHEGAPAPVLGVGALQLSPDRDPLAPHAEAVRPGDLDLPALVAKGLVRNLSPALLKAPPRIAATAPETRAALGYLHANCGHCHNAVDSGAGVPVGIDVIDDVVAGAAGVALRLATMLDRPSRFRPNGHTAGLIVAPGNAATSMLALRMRTRDPNTQMPPLGTDLVDTEGIALIERWINLNPKKEASP